MKIIDLLNKIANGEEVPIKFTYKGYLWEYDAKNKMWFYYFGESKSHRFDRLFYLNMILNDEVEILEEEKKFTKEDFIKEAMDLEDITKETFNERYEVKECNCGRKYCKGFIKVEKVQEENKIPEKLGTYKITDETISGIRKSLNTMINIDIIGTINEIIDYLKNKGDE